MSSWYDMRKQFFNRYISDLDKPEHKILHGLMRYSPARLNCNIR